MLNTSHLQHLTLLARIYAAMRRAVRTGLPQYIVNKKGQPFIRVTYSRNMPNAFTFFDKMQVNVTKLVLNVLRSK